ncbi:MAG: thioredoxin domain-containing protein [Burkholderiales bacterium]|nr:thioredoxin domain-containing protein [Burkholderiales bacterium]
MKPRHPLAILLTASLLSIPTWSIAADRVGPPSSDEVRALRDEVRTLQQDMRDLKQALAARRAGGWEKVDAVVGPEDSPQLGAQDARLVLIEFSDYQCPYCVRHYTETFKQLERDYIAAGKLRYVVAEMPIAQIHPLASKAAEAARCAREQGKFWEMHGRLFSNPRQLEPWSAHAEALGLDAGAFQSCLDSGRHAEEITRNAAAAQQSGISSTPTFLLGIATGDTVRVVRRLRGAAPYAAFKAEIDALLAEPVALK